MTDFISGKAAIAGDEPVQFRLKWELTKTLRIMKLAAFFLFVAAMHVSAKGLTQDKITLSLKNAPLEKVFDAIETQSGFVFIYKNETVKDKKVSIQVSNVSLAAALDECLKGQALSYSIVGKSVAIKTIHKDTDLAANETANAPPLIDVKGKVLNEKGDPLEGVTVRVKGSEKFTLTDKSGEFSLVTVERDAILLFTHITMESFELKVSGQTELLIKLRTKVSALGEVTVTVNTGYQQVSKERFVGSVSTLDSAAYNRRAGMDIISRLDGTVTGLLFDKKSSGISQLQNVQIRGLSTLETPNSPSKAPLIIVDNFPYKQDLSTLNPNDVDNITVLKDAAATSIWGAQAGNGVIVITTKRGKYNQPFKVSATSNFTIEEKPDLYYYPQMSIPDFIEAEEFLFANGKYDADLNNTTSWPVMSPVVELLARKRAGKISDAEYANQIEGLKSLDLRRDLNKYVYRNAVQQQHYLNLSGGSNIFNYNFSVGYNHNLNNIQNSKPDNQFTLNAFTGFRPVKNLEVNTRIIYTKGFQKSASFSLPSKIYPYAQLADAEGNPLAVPSGNRLAFLDTAGGGKLLDWRYRPLEEVGLQDANNTSQSVMLNLDLHYKITSWLNAVFSYRYNTVSSDIKSYFSPETYYTRNLINQYTNLSQTNPDLRNPLPMGGILDILHGESQVQNVRGQLNFNKRFNSRHLVTALIAAEQSETKGSGNNGRYYGYNKDKGSYKSSVDFNTAFPTYANLNANQQVFNGNTLKPGTTNRFVSFIGNASYTYNDRYTFYASARRDGSNVFGVNTNKKWNPLWSVGASWDVSKESFYNLNEWVPNLRLRTSYGYTGNPGNVSGLPTITYSTALAYLTNLPAATPNAAPNPDLRWEKVRIINAAIDFGFLKNRITGSFEIFQKNSSDVISATPFAPSTGITLYNTNTANLKGNGFEINLTSKNTNGAVKWQTVLGLSYTKTVVTKLFYKYYDAKSFLSYSINASEGKMTYGMASYKWGGLDPLTGDPRGYQGKQPTNNYIAIINDSLENQVFHGSAIPLYFGFLNNSVNWKNFTLSANISYRLDFYFRKPTINYDRLANSWDGNADYANRWKKPGDENFTNVPSFVYPVDYNRDYFYQYSEVNVLRGDNVRWQDVRLQYLWEPRGSKNKFLKSANAYLYVNNLNVIIWRKDNSSKLDPDFTGGQTFTTPTPKSWTVGVNLNF